MDDQVIKLYEYDYDKPELSEETLEHHGILGMSWGVRNGPPYPLGSDVSTGKRLRSGGKHPSKRKLRKASDKRVKSLKKAKKESQIQKSKEDIIKTKDLDAMVKTIDNFSNQEINDMLNRLSTEDRLRSKLREVTEASKSPGQKWRENFVKQVKKSVGEGVTNTVSNVAKNAPSAAANAVVSQLAKTTDKETARLLKQIFKDANIKIDDKEPIKTYNVYDMLKNKGRYSTNEMQEAYKRYLAEQNIEKMVNEKRNKKKKKKEDD